MRVTRVYEVQFENEEVVLQTCWDCDYPQGELLDVCTRLADGGDLSGSVIVVEHEDDEGRLVRNWMPESDWSFWADEPDAKILYGSVSYKCEEVIVNFD